MSEEKELKAEVEVRLLGRCVIDKNMYFFYILSELAEYLQTCPSSWTYKEILADLSDRRNLEPEGLHRDVLSYRINAYKHAFMHLFDSPVKNENLPSDVTADKLLKHITERFLRIDL